MHDDLHGVELRGSKVKQKRSRERPKKTHVRIAPDQLERLRRISERTGVPVGTLLERILDDVVGRVERGEVELPDVAGELGRLVDIMPSPRDHSSPLGQGVARAA